MPATWPEALSAAAEAIQSRKPGQLKAIAGDYACVESMVVLKDMMNRLGSNNTVCQTDGVQHNADTSTDYIINSSIPGLEMADLVLLVGCNPRMEAPVLNARLRKGVLLFGLEVANVGPAADLRYKYPVEELGDSLNVLIDIANGKHAFNKRLAEAEYPIILVGNGALRGDGAKQVQAAIDKIGQHSNVICDDWNGIGYLQTAAARVGALDLGFVPGPDADDAGVSLVYNLGADEEGAMASIPDNAFVIYQGTHGDVGAQRADIIFPGASYMEKNGTYVNADGRVQRTQTVVAPVGNGRSDWQIVRALAEVCGASLPYDTEAGVRDRLIDIAPSFANVNGLEYRAFLRPSTAADLKRNGDASLDPYFKSHWKTDPITRASVVMGHCETLLPTSDNSYL